jgi:transcriptional regulator with XRE-family HTH domain
MSLTSKQIREELNNLSTSLTKKDRLEVDARLLVAQFIDPILRIMKSNKKNRKVLAKEIGTSASFITQLFRGDKTINFLTLAKIQNAMGVEFEVRLKSELNTEFTFLNSDEYDGIWGVHKNNLTEPKYQVEAIETSSEKKLVIKTA